MKPLLPKAIMAATVGTFEFAAKDKLRADFAADVKVVILDAKGHAALKVKSDRPFLLAKVVPGAHVVKATLAGRTLHKKVAVTSVQPAKLVFL